MPPRLQFFKNIAKDLVIETVAVGAAYLTNTFVEDLKDSTGLLSTTLSLRIYYLTKNILNAFDMKYHHVDYAKPMYAGCFNAGVAATLFPGTHYIGMENASNRISTAAAVYAGGLLLRTPVEIYHGKKRLKTFLVENYGSLIGGTVGTAFSALQGASIASPSFYWSGQLVDIYNKKAQAEPLLNFFLQSQTTVTLQVFGAYTTKLILSLTKHPLPFAGFIIDAMLGFFHRVVLHVRNQQRLPLNIVPVVVPIPEIQISETKQATVSSSALVQSMAHGSTMFRSTPLPDINLIATNKNVL